MRGVWNNSCRCCFRSDVWHHDTLSVIESWENNRCWKIALLWDGLPILTACERIRKHSLKWKVEWIKYEHYHPLHWWQLATAIATTSSSSNSHNNTNNKNEQQPTDNHQTTNNQQPTHNQPTTNKQSTNNHQTINQGPSMPLFRGVVFGVALPMLGPLEKHVTTWVSGGPRLWTSGALVVNNGVRQIPICRYLQMEKNRKGLDYHWWPTTLWLGPSKWWHRHR